MNIYVSFGDLMQFGMFLIMLMTFIYQMNR